MSEVREQVLEQGYATVEFDVSHEDRRRAALLGNLLIDIALEDERIGEGLSMNISGDGPAGYLGDLGVGKPRVASDRTRYFHSGWQSREHMAATLPPRFWPEGMDEFFDAQRTILDTTTRAWMNFMGELRPDVAHHDGGLIDIIRSPDPIRNQHILRINRYLDLPEYSGDNPTFTAHGDLSLASAHLFETHRKHLHIAPYPLGNVSNEPLTVEQRAREAQRIREQRAQPAEIHTDEVALFLGFGAAFVADRSLTVPLKDLVAAYHHGEPPEVEDPADDRVAEDFGEGVRVSMVGFASPNIDTPFVQYQMPTKYACRPEMMLRKTQEALGVAPDSSVSLNPHA